MSYNLDTVAKLDAQLKNNSYIEGLVYSKRIELWL
ncbi:hypothetical protein JL09_g5995 [Pichia kudriavzevii]|uniref:Uncharacterized protein n=1 Tax=Pichia kudriavzevii TaxID=4909 RepID=A0A099NQP7_PICKU|nr:hypothetical protein JL09_g6001 [Pichia kudriavzevii]KGK34856.1 hypothetical protein JL09_g5995 [Pichia kudriavzevii]